MKIRVHMLNCFLLLLFFARVSGAVAEQIVNDPMAEHLFNEGIILYRNGQYDEASNRFISALERPLHHRMTIVMLMAAKANLKLTSYSEAIALSNRLMTEFPNSKYVEDAHFVKASALYLTGDYPGTLKNLLEIVNVGKSEQLVNECKDLASQIIDSHISFQQLRQLLTDFTEGEAQAILILKIAYLEITTGQSSRAKQRLKQFLQDNPNKKYVRPAQDLQILADNYIPSTLKVGVILPVSGYFSNEGRDLLRGIKMALDEYNPYAAIKIELVVRDSEGRALNSVKKARELVAEKDLLCIVGELESDNTIGIAAVTEALEIPFLVPTVTENGITSLSKTIFQLNNDLHTRGSRLAEYAINNMGLKTFATLAPADEYGKGLTDAFVETVDRLGGQVVAEMWYYEGAEKVDRQLQSIREAGFRYKVRNLLENQGISVTMARIDSMLWANQSEYGISFRTRDGSSRRIVISDFNVPIRSIDGIFLPIYKEDIAFILPQFLLQNIRSQILGGDYWYEDIELLRQFRNQINNTVFISGRFWEEFDPQIRNFINEFRKLFSTTPGPFAVYGYDTMRLIIQAVEDGVRNRIDLVKYLESLDNFDGLHGKISFVGSNRVNSFVHILVFRDGIIQKVNDVN